MYVCGISRIGINLNNDLHVLQNEHRLTVRTEKQINNFLRVLKFKDWTVSFKK